MLRRTVRRLVHGSQAGVFQPFHDTMLDRYPEIFDFVRTGLTDRPTPRLLSVGCSTGQELVTLKGYLPRATVHGVDVNRDNAGAARALVRRSGLRGIQVSTTGDLSGLRQRSCDAVFAMAVLRHGDLSFKTLDTCRPLLYFSRFEDFVDKMTRLRREDGLLVVQASNFRVCDTRVAAHLEPVFSIDNGHYHPQLPLYGPDDRRLDVPSYDEVVFRRVQQRD